MSRFQARTRVLLNTDGKTGAWLLVCGPIVSAVCYWLAVNESLAGQGRMGFLEMLLWIATFAGGIAPLAGVVLLIVGREYVHDIKSVE